jgi:hypothetical protein
MRCRYTLSSPHLNLHKSFRFEKGKKCPGKDSYTLSDQRDSFEELGLDLQNSRENLQIKC